MKNGTRVPSFDVANIARVSNCDASIGGSGASKAMRDFAARSYRYTVGGTSGELKVNQTSY